MSSVFGTARRTGASERRYTMTDARSSSDK
jgi:hypothetical protein